ncbi:TPA: hypothetical protein ACH3X3_014217 [Trebouxia sp. C0006]
MTDWALSKPKLCLKQLPDGHCVAGLSPTTIEQQGPRPHPVPSLQPVGGQAPWTALCLLAQCHVSECTISRTNMEQMMSYKPHTIIDMDAVICARRCVIVLNQGLQNDKVDPICDDYKCRVPRLVQGSHEL